MGEPNIRHQGGLRPYLVVGAIALATFVGEAVLGLVSGALMLLADATHTLFDGVALSLAIWFEAWHDHRSSEQNERLQKVIRVVIGLMIVGAGATFGFEAMTKEDPLAQQQGWTVIGAAILCAGLNFAMQAALGSCPCTLDKSLRVHIKSDLWISIGVAISGTLTLMTGWRWIDPVASLLIGLWIVGLGIGVALGTHDHSHEEGHHH